VDSNVQKEISAQVILKPAQLTSAEDIANEFQRGGMRVGPLMANSFSITASEEVFERFFGVKLEIGPKGEVHVAGRSGAGRFELPLDQLNPEIVEGVESVLFTPLPDFGATGNF
jgi:hypothetical protein